MNPTRLAVAIGVGLTTFLFVGAGTIELLGGDFPTALVALPIAMLGGVAVAVATFLRVDADASRTVQSVAEGIAAFGYAFLALQALTYAVAAAREPLGGGLRQASIALVVAVVVAAAAWLWEPVVERS